MASQNKTTGFIAFDIETTGAYMPTDVLFAIGMAWAAPTATKASEIQTWKAILDLGKPQDQPWKDFWAEKKFEPRCWNEFWSKNEAMLDSLQAQATIQGEVADLVAVFNAKLKEVEEQFDQTVTIFDCVCFDSVWLSAQLMSHGFKALNYTRAGRYRYAYETDSLGEGSLHVDGMTDWKAYADARAARINCLLPGLGKSINSHDPEEDAAGVIKTYLRLREFGVQQAQREHEVRTYLDLLRSTAEAMARDSGPSVSRDMHIRNLLKRAPRLD